MESGTKLGHYEISTLLGKGGMGEVWRAKDTKLGREVAIKTLPEEFAKDVDRLARFEREAKLLASLNHPNIAAIYGLEEHEGARFLVLELVEGDTLAGRLNRGPIPIEESLKIALQIADALKAAHDKGIIHRDLKPLNIKVTDDDTVKVLDFGLAKAFAGDEAEASVSNSPTLSMAATQQGVILGTAAYMSPEQAKGRKVDKRTDVWAFGCVLYEMLTGRQSFGASDVTESLAAVISLPPKWETLPENLHPRLRETVERCLEKQVAKRSQDIGDVKLDIEKVLSYPNGVLVQPVAEVIQASPQSKLPWVVAVLGIIVAGVAVWVLKPEPPPEPGVVSRFRYLLPDDQIFTNIEFSTVDVSPDGTRFVYVRDGQLHLRDFGQFDSAPIRGTDEGPAMPVFSPDGESLVYSVPSAAFQVKRIPVSGGSPITIWPGEEGSGLFGISWHDDALLFSQPEGIVRLGSGGGELEVVVPAADGEILFGAERLPDGKGLLFGRATEATAAGFDAAAILVLTPDGERITVWTGGSDARYVPTGHIVFAQGDTLFAVGFDLDGLEVQGTPVPVVEGVTRSGNELTHTANYAFSDNGTLVYADFDFGNVGSRNLVFVDRNGQTESVGFEAGIYSTPRVSPDASRIAYTRTDESGVSNVWIYNLSGTTQPRQLTFEGMNRYPVWSSDSDRVAFQSSREDRGSIFWRPADGTGSVQRLTMAEEDFAHIPESFSPDSRSLLYSVRRAVTGSIWTLDLETLESSVFAEVPDSLVWQSLFSPDGQWVAYQSNETGEDEIFVKPFPPTEARYQLPNTQDNHHPLWSPDGTELYYVPGPIQFAVVSVTTTPGFEFGNPEAISANLFVPGAPTVVRNTDILPDRERLVAVGPALGVGDRGDAAIHVVLNWFEELKEGVPVP